MATAKKRSPRSRETYSFWEMMGATTGPTRGQMAHRIDGMGKNGWNLELNLSTVGTDGPWPHSMAIFRLPSETALQERLDAGFADGLDERDLRWTRNTLATRLRGEFLPSNDAYLLEYVRCESREVLENYADPDLVFVEPFAPWQGIVMWAAKDINALGKREQKGIGSVGKPGIIKTHGWWVVVAQRALV